MHPTETVQAKSCATAVQSKKIGAVNVKSSDGWSIRTHALLNPASNLFFCSVKLLQDLTFNGVRVSLLLETLTSGLDTEVKQTSLEVASMNKKANGCFASQCVRREGFPYFKR